MVFKLMPGSVKDDFVPILWSGARYVYRGKKCRCWLKNGGADRATDASGVTLTPDVLGAMRPLRRSVRTESIVLAIGIFGLAWSDAIAQYDGTRDCESFANAFYKKKDPGFRLFTIDKNTVEEIRIPRCRRCRRTSRSSMLVFLSIQWRVHWFAHPIPPLAVN
jgi:hypothetical protein